MVSKRNTFKPQWGYPTQMMKDVLEVVICGRNVLVIYTPDMEERARWYYAMWLLEKRHNVKLIKLPDELSVKNPELLEDALKEIVKDNCG